EARIDHLPITNQELADWLLHNAHDTFNKSLDHLDPNLTHAGISVRKTDDDLYSIIHNLPTVYLAKFLQQDLDFFVNAKRAMGDSAWGQWDRGWLELLTEQGRIKVVGSSDMAMAVELTSDDRTPPLWNGLQYNDLYDHRRRRPYNMVFNKFLYVLRPRPI
ncbi:MAG: hypothetical protein QMD05_10020, partial [Candidatus Brocadiaceae bacterium]|nr:hypothetical protein [Candidatus Brocadiaceae bacterium]